ncbi:hypothetical protein [Streptomyces sp. NPDC001070]
MTPDDPHITNAGKKRGRRATAAALLTAGVCAMAFTAFAVVTTQDKGIRATSPWQNDPYDGVVSFTAFLVPFMAGLVAVRALRWRDSRGQLSRRRQLLRAAFTALVMIAATALTDWLAVAVRADRHAWTGTTGWLIGALAAQTCLTAASLAAVQRALRLLPAATAPDDQNDWLDDLPSLCPPGLIGLVRRHVTAVLAGLALFTGLAITTMQAVGEDWASPLLFLTGTAIGTGGFFALGAICNTVLHIAHPSPRNRPPATGLRRAGRMAVIVAALGLPAAAVLRESVWRGVGLAGAVDSPGRFAAVTFGGALTVGLLVFCVQFAATGADRGSSRHLDDFY